MNKTLSVSAIENGTVVDHVRAGQALRIMRLLQVLENKNEVTLGLNLPSQRIKLKDLIKIKNRTLTHEEAGEIGIFAPEVTINIIKNFSVTEKIQPNLPTSILEVFICPNTACITHHEPIGSFFYIEEQGKQIKLTCHYCEKVFDRDQVKVKI